MTVVCMLGALMMAHLFFLLMYVDDMLIAAKSIVEVNKLKVLLSREFDTEFGLSQEDSWDGDLHGQECQEIVAISGRLYEGVGED
jgi:hypothetical protein